MQTLEQLQQRYEQLSEQGTRLAGRLTDLAQRAAVYHHVFEDSGRNHIFPLIAAHGALWARGYFAFGMKLGRLLSWQYPFSPAKRAEAQNRLTEFADAFREINRQVCVDTYASYHFTSEFGDHPDASQIIAPQLLDALCRIHAARRTGRELNTLEKRGVFEAHFLNEQQHVVGPRIAKAIEAFDWPLLKGVALRPLVQFSYFRQGEFFWFQGFHRTEERIARGLRAFDIGARVGWKEVEASLDRYAVLPESFFVNSTQHFAMLRDRVLAHAC